MQPDSYPRLRIWESERGARTTEKGFPFRHYVADSALVSRDNLAALGEGIRFITRWPASYVKCDRVIQAAVEADQWEALGRIAQSPATKNRPGAHYWLWEGEVCLYGGPHRAVVVHSSAHDRRRQKPLEREHHASEIDLSLPPKPAPQDPISIA